MFWWCGSLLVFYFGVTVVILSYVFGKVAHVQ